MLQTIETALGELGGIIWGPYVLIPLLLLTGLYLTVRLAGCSSTSWAPRCDWPCSTARTRTPAAATSPSSRR